jgi:hypothetical protein
MSDNEMPHKSFFGKSEGECRRVVRAKGWKASIVKEQ